MKKNIIIMGLCALLVSCGSSGIWKNPKSALKEYFTTQNEGKELEFDDIEEIYGSDSLKIYSAKVTLKNDIIPISYKVEYIYLTHDGKDYEYGYVSDDHSYFIRKEAFTPEKKENKGITYDDAVYANAAKIIIKAGRPVGDVEEREMFSIPTKQPIGTWNALEDYTFTFGRGLIEKNGEKYAFSPSVTVYYPTKYFQRSPYILLNIPKKMDIGRGSLSVIMSTYDGSKYKFKETEPSYEKQVFSEENEAMLLSILKKGGLVEAKGLYKTYDAEYKVEFSFIADGFNYIMENFVEKEE